MKLTPSKEEKKLKELIEKSDKILLLTHVRLDHDAICSTLMTYHFITNNFPSKKVEIYIQEEDGQWPKYKEFELENFNVIKNITPKVTVDLSKFDLGILLDVYETNRCLPNHTGKTKLAVIDHHDSPVSDDFETIINEGRSSATEQVFLTFKRLLGKKFIVDNAVSKYTYVGIFADTGRFLYSKVSSDTYEIMAEVKKINNLSSEEIWKKIINMDARAVQVLGEAINNMKIEGNLCYTFISEEYQTKNGLSNEQIKSGVSDNFLASIARYIKGVEWAFAVFPIGKDTWKISFRSIGGIINVEPYARILGGGGHKAAASTNIQASSAEEAVEKAKQAISQNPS